MRFADKNGDKAIQVSEDDPDNDELLHSSHYYPFGMEMEGPTFAQGGNWSSSGGTENRYTYNGKEAIEEFNVGWLDYGARYYDASIGRFTTVDRFASDFAERSPYHYASNNPIRFIDINGDSTYVMIWATANGEIGHAGIAVNNYDEDGNADGTYTYYDLWPGGDGAGKDNFDQDVKAYYAGSGEGQVIGSKDELLNFTVNGLEKHSADGIIQFATDAVEDATVQETLTSFSSSNSKYNGVSCNCSDFVAQGVESATGERINATEQIGKYTSTTPNALYKAASNTTGAKVIRNPGKKVNNDFITGASGGGVRAKVGRKRVN